MIEHHAAISGPCQITGEGRATIEDDNHLRRYYYRDVVVPRLFQQCLDDYVRHVSAKNWPDAIRAREAEQRGYRALWALDRLLDPVAPLSRYPGTADGSLPPEQRVALDPPPAREEGGMRVRMGSLRELVDALETSRREPGTCDLVLDADPAVALQQEIQLPRDVMAVLRRCLARRQAPEARAQGLAARAHEGEERPEVGRAEGEQPPAQPVAAGADALQQPDVHEAHEERVGLRLRDVELARHGYTQLYWSIGDYSIAWFWCSIGLTILLGWVTKVLVVT